MIHKAILVVWVAALTLGCGRRVTFDHLRQADRIEVRHKDQVLQATEDRSTITKARQFITSRSDGWDKDWAGTPIPVFVVYFLSGKQVLGGYGVGPDLLTTDPGPDFLSRSISSEESAEIAGILGVGLERR